MIIKNYAIDKKTGDVKENYPVIVPPGAIIQVFKTTEEEALRRSDDPEWLENARVVVKHNFWTLDYKLYVCNEKEIFPYINQVMIDEATAKRIDEHMWRKHL